MRRPSPRRFAPGGPSQLPPATMLLDDDHPQQEIIMAVSYFVRMRAVEGQEQLVQEVLLSNMQRIRGGERGNLAFAVHRSQKDPREFWLYETWTDLDAVEAHESGPDFKAY